MRLNDGKSMFKGRPLKFDVASPPSNQSRRGSLNRSSSRAGDRNSVNSQVDGSSFRGGRYVNRRDSSSSLRRQSSVSSDTSETARQRPSLKLAPRSKPTQGEQTKESSQSSLFGGGKARDDVEWERRRSETKQQDRRGSASSTGGGQDRRGSASSTSDRRGSASSTGGGGGRGRGNKGRGGGSKTGGRGGGRGKGKDGSKKNQQKEAKPKEKETEAAPKEVPKPPPAVEPAKPATTKVQNKFLALNMDSDSD